MIQKAVVTYAVTGETVLLAPSSLAELGVTVDSKSLTIYTEDSQLAGAVMTIEVRSTVEEELTWFNTMVVQVTFLSSGRSGSTECLVTQA